MALIVMAGCFILSNSAKETGYIDVEVNNILIKEKLQYSKEIILYTGISENEHLLKEPSPENVYILFELNVFNGNENKKYNSKNLMLNIDDNKYKQITKNEFLNKFGYQFIRKNISHQSIENGYIIFEVSKLDASKAYSKWWIEDENNVNINLESVAIKDNIPKSENLIEKQNMIDSKLLEEYSKKEYSIKSPYIKVNPYGNAPLAAIALFKSEEEVEIKVTVESKNNNNDDIEYVINGFNKEHEIPLIGLYPNKNNEIILSATNKNGEVNQYNIKVKTDKLSKDLTNSSIEVVTKDKKNMEEGLTFVIDDNRTVIDSNGDIRWLLTDIDGEKIDISGVEEFLSNGRMLLSTNSYELFSTIYEVDWLGKVHWSYSSEDTAHHEAEELPNGNILYSSSNFIYEVERYSNNVINKVSFQDILTNQNKSLEIRGDSTDWFHINSIEFDQSDNSIIISSRNQHSVIKLGYPSLEIKWILSAAKGIQANLNDKYINEYEGVEWFYSQHQPSILPDIDDNQDTIDILLFDNGVHRGLTQDIAIKESKMYSRIVHYRIDEIEKTVTQIFDFGKEQGLSFYSDIQSGAQYLPNTGNYLGAFDSGTLPNWSQEIQLKNKDNKSHIVEVDKSGKIIYQVDLKTAYRSYRKKTDVFGKGYSKLGESGIYSIIPQKYIDIKADDVKEEIKFDILSLKENNGYLNIEGYAFLKDIPTLSDKLYLILENEDTSYYYNLLRSNTTIIPVEDLNISQDERNNNPNITRGFKTKFINLNNIDVGTYKINIGVSKKESNEIATIDTGYRYTKNGTIEEKQKIIDLEISERFNENLNTLQNPLIIKDPYEVSPLTALMLFKTDNESKISIRIKGKDKQEDIVHDFNEYKLIHDIPIHGLYPAYLNKIEITAEFRDGTKVESKVDIQTLPLPNDFQSINVVKSVPEKMESGFTFMVGAMSNSIYPMAIDSSGNVRWFLNDKSLGSGGPIRKIANGNIIISSNESFKAPYYVDSFFEINFLGKIKDKHEVNEFHHDAIEISNGNFIALANNPKRPNVVEDYIVEIDKDTSEVVRSWDMTEILSLNSEADENYSNFGAHDWLHINAIDYSEVDNSLIISSRHQDAIIKFNIDSNEIMWILSDPNDVWPEHLREKLLKSVDDSFTFNYGQHAVMELDNGDILMFDNGNFKSKSKDEKVNPNDNYSRLLRVSIDNENKTVSQVFEYGKERGNELFSAYVGDVDVIKDNYLITFGGIIKDKENNSYDSPSDLLSNTSEDIYGESVVIELNSGEVVFEVKVSNLKFGNIYRTERINVY